MSMIFLLPFLGVVLWLLTTVFGGGPGPVRRGLRGAPAVCGACGYAVRGDLSGRCPECGAPHEEAGVVTRSVLLAFAPPLWVVACALLVLAAPLAVVVQPLVRAGLNRLQYGVTTVTQRTYRYRTGPAYGPDRTLGDARPDYTLAVTMDVLLEPTTSSPFSGTIELQLTGMDVTTHAVTYDVETRAWIMRDAGGDEVERGTEIEPAAEALFRRAGASELWAGSSAEVRDARRLADVLTGPAPPQWAGESFEAYGLAGLGGGGGGSSRVAGAWAGVVSPIVAIALWLGAPALAILWLARRRRRLRAATTG